MSQAGIQVRTGKKWRGSGSSGSICKVGGHGHKRLSWSMILHHSPNIRGKGKHYLVQEEVTAAVEETRTCRAVEINQQGVWSRWKEMI